MTLTEQQVLLITATRVPLETVVRAFHLGATAEGIAQDFPSLTLAQVYAVIAYYLANRESADHYVAEQTAARAARRAQAQSNPLTADLRARLLARR